MDHLYEITLRRQLESQRAATNELKAQVSELTTLLKTHIGSGAAVIPAGECGAAAQIAMNGPVAMASGAGASASVTQNTIHVHLFGQEDTRHIGRAEIKSLLDRTLRMVRDPSQAALQALLGAATMIYSDPQRPENLTCYIPNKKHDNVLVHGEGGWQVQPYQVILPPMVTYSIDKLFDNQPFIDAERYGELMTALKNNEEAYKAGREMHGVLVRNKDLLEKALGKLPK